MNRERKDPLVEIADLAEELADPRQHTERIYGWTKQRNRKVVRLHTTIQPGLVTQLRDAVYTLFLTTDGQAPRGRATLSRPPLQLEALSRLMDIALDTNEWMHDTRLPNRGGIEPNIRALVGAAPRLDCDLQHNLLTDLRRWRGWAAVMSGWALPPYQPHVPCPNPECGKHGTLRIVAERQTATCSECKHIWDDTDGSIRMLARYIAAENARPRIKVPIGSTASGHGGWTARRIGA